MNAPLRGSCRLLGLIVLCGALAMPAAGQPVADHLKCYKLKKDPLQKASYTADLGGLVAEPGCTIKVPATMACVPATKTAAARVAAACPPPVAPGFSDCVRKE